MTLARIFSIGIVAMFVLVWTATAFSPTDISAVRPWAKLLMITEAAVSLGIAGLVIARAINILG